MRLRLTRFVAPLLAALLLPVATVAQQSSETARATSPRGLPGDTGGAAAAARRLRALYDQRDFEGACIEGRVLVRRFPASTELRAWWIAARAANGPHEEALAAAGSLARAHPGDRWADFARVEVLARSAEPRRALALARRGHATAPRDPDMTRALVDALSAAGQYEAIVALVDTAIADGRATAGLLAAKSEAEQTAAWGAKQDTTAHARAEATARQALRADSTDFAAQLALADALANRGDNAAAYPEYRRLLTLAPLSRAAHEEYWSGILSLKDRTPEQKREEITRAAKPLLAARGDYPGVLQAVAGIYRRVQATAAADSLEATLLTRFPDSYEVERMLVNRFRAFGTPLAGKQPDDSVRPEMRRQLQAFIRRPVHRSEASLGEAYTTLFWLLRDDSTVPGAELARVVEGMRRHQQGAAFIVTSAPIVLADRGVALDLAEALAREIPRRDSANLAFFKRSDPEQYSLALKQSRTHLHDALGWIALRRGRRVTARAELGQALAILPQDTSALLHMGLLEEKVGNLAAAEALFARGYTAERAARNHPHEQALRRVYLARHGSLAGYEALVAKLSEQERAERRARILAERLKQPRALPPFRLAHLDGTVVASDSLRGKVVFLNFWGAWCGPCVLEAPLIQTLHERYRAAPDVAFLTIDMGDDTTRIREFMAQRKLDFPVLIDDRYVMTSGVRGFPTDWFVGPDGRIAFETNGGTDAESMVEEFAWRIEVLRAEKATAPPAARGAR